MGALSASFSYCRSLPNVGSGIIEQCKGGRPATNLDIFRITCMSLEFFMQQAQNRPKPINGSWNPQMEPTICGKPFAIKDYCARESFLLHDSVSPHTTNRTREWLQH